MRFATFAPTRSGKATMAARIDELGVLHFLYPDAIEVEGREVREEVPALGAGGELEGER